MAPLVTVLMPVYNAAPYLRSAIESILGQTWRDFELLVINDGSSDQSVAIVQSYNDPRIRLVHNDSNLKLIATLNKGLALAQGRYIARMDGDDISLPQRLARQVAFMERQPQVGICGTWIQVFGHGNFVMNYPSTDQHLQTHMLFATPFAHPTVMLRRDFFGKYQLRYNSDYPHAEDWRLWQESADHFALANIPEILLHYRLTPGSVSQANQQSRLQTVSKILARGLTRLGVTFGEMDVELHKKMGLGIPAASQEELARAAGWLQRLHEANQYCHRYDPEILATVMGHFYFALCYASSWLGLGVWQQWHDSPWASHSQVGLWRQMKFGVRCGIKYHRGE